MFLALDAGGTSSRAVLLDTSGRVFGYGRAGSGNPTAAGVGDAVSAIGAAAEQALMDLASSERPAVALIVMAGEKTTAFREKLFDRLAVLGIRQVVLDHDLLGIFNSGTAAEDGYAVIAGTGTVAARIRNGRLDQVAGGKGWLLGDAGGGFWIGQAVARAVVAALDGQAPDTTLTGLMLEAMQIEADLEFAPLAFAAHDDPVARPILVSASAALADLLAAVRSPDLTGPVVVGGSVIVRGMLAAPADLRAALVPLETGDGVIPVSDGLVGAAVLVLRHARRNVDETLLRTIQAEVERIRTAS
jgi:glucosamine kinase